eukprot:210108-Pleurochrysis_carterae.AAC.1
MGMVSLMERLSGATASALRPSVSACFLMCSQQALTAFDASFPPQERGGFEFKLHLWDHSDADCERKFGVPPISVRGNTRTYSLNAEVTRVARTVPAPSLLSTDGWYHHGKLKLVELYRGRHNGSGHGMFVARSPKSVRDFSDNLLTGLIPEELFT